MSSNPFRRKLSDGTPIPSTRASFDIDEARIQQVAQEAFSPINSQFDDPIPIPEQEKVGVERDAVVQSDIVEAKKSVELRPEHRDERPSSSHSLRQHISSSAIRPSSSGRDAPRPTPSPAPAISPLATPPLKATKVSSRSLATPPPPPPPPRGVLRKSRNSTPVNTEIPKPVVTEINHVVVPPTPVDPFNEGTFTEEPTEIEEQTTLTQRSALADKTTPPVEDHPNLEKVDEEDEEEPYPSSRKESIDSVISNSSAKLPNLPFNPFRQNSDTTTTDRRRSLEFDGPRFTGKVQSKPDRKAVRQSLDVDTFKRLMLTGQSIHTTSTSSTDTSNISRPSYAESTPRTSQDIGEEDAPKPQPLSNPTTTTTGTKDKPVPPKPRRHGSKLGRSSSSSSVIPTQQSHYNQVTNVIPDTPDHPQSRKSSLTNDRESPSPTPTPIRRLSLQSNDSFSTSESSKPRRPPIPPAVSSSGGKKPPLPPTPPLVRRASAHIHTSDIPDISSTLTPPPPPPTRRVFSSSSLPTGGGDSDTITPSKTTENLDTKPSSLAKSLRAAEGGGNGGGGGSGAGPDLPPTRRSNSKRSSMPPGGSGVLGTRSPVTMSPRLVPTTTSSTSPAPPPPPRRRKDVYAMSQEVVGEEQARMDSLGVGTGRGEEILDDLTKLQREVDELRGKLVVS